MRFSISCFFSKVNGQMSIRYLMIFFFIFIQFSRSKSWTLFILKFRRIGLKIHEDLGGSWSIHKSNYILRYYFYGFELDKLKLKFRNLASDPENKYLFFKHSFYLIIDWVFFSFTPSCELWSKRKLKSLSIITRVEKPSHFDEELAPLWLHTFYKM